MNFFTKGVLCYLLSLPNDWVVKGWQIANNFQESEMKILRAIRELIDLGYCKRTPLRDGSRLRGQRYQITDIPFNFAEVGELQTVENSDNQNFQTTEISDPLKNGGSEKNNNIYTNKNTSIIKNDKPKQVRQRATSENLCLFEDSKFADIDTFCQQFPAEQYGNIDIIYYYNAVADWSAQSGKKKRDWIATARNFMRGDKDKGHLHMIKENNGSGLSQDAINYLQSMMEL